MVQVYALETKYRHPANHLRLRLPTEHALCFPTTGLDLGDSHRPFERDQRSHVRRLGLDGGEGEWAHHV